MGHKVKASSIDASSSQHQQTGSNAGVASAFAHLTFAEVLEDLSSRFIVNLPAEELSSIERICFQVEQAHWFYEDFLRPLNPTLASFSLRRFSSYLLHTSSLTVPLIQRYISTTPSGASNTRDLEAAFDDFMKYKTRVPVCGVVMLNSSLDQCVLVKGWKSSAAWGFPKGKINQQESERDCAVREVLEETGFDCASLLPPDSPDYMELTMREQKIRLYIVPGVDEGTHFETMTRKEISRIAWFKLSDLPTWKKNKAPPQGMGGKFYLISPFVGKLKQWIQQNRSKSALSSLAITEEAHVPHSSDELKKLLGLGKEGDMARGPQMIEEQGDARSRQLLDLLRGDVMSNEKEGVMEASLTQQPQVYDENDRGTAALLSALDAGAGKESQVSTSDDQSNSAMLLSMLKGSNGTAPAPAESLPQRTRNSAPLPAPQPQKTSQAQSLLNLISPIHSSPSNTLVDLSDKERERARQRDALLSNLLSSSDISPVSMRAPMPDSQMVHQFQFPLPASHSHQEATKSKMPSSKESDLLSLLQFPSASREAPKPAQSPFSSFVQQQTEAARVSSQSCHPQSIPNVNTSNNESANLLNLLNGRPAQNGNNPTAPISPSSYTIPPSIAVYQSGYQLPPPPPQVAFQSTSYSQPGLYSPVPPIPNPHIYYAPTQGHQFHPTNHH